MSDEPFTDWLLSRPPEIQRLACQWPPLATVRTKPGVSLKVPAPGVEGQVASWFENGNIGVEAPLPDALTNPRGETLDSGAFLRGECSPDDLELVCCAELPDGRVLDGELMRELVAGERSEG